MNVNRSTLKLMRLNLGLTQIQVAREVGISRSYLAMLERGVRKLTRPMLRRLLDVYGLNVDGSAKQRTDRDGASADGLKHRMVKAQQTLATVQQMFDNALTHTVD